MLIDIGVTNPLAAHNRFSLLRQGPGGGAANTERRKRLYYKDIDRTKYIYYPFILETCGAFGQPALKLCSKLRKIWLTKCCNGNDSPNFSQNLESPTTIGSTDPLLVSLSTLLQSHNGQMILERSPLSPKLLNSAIDRSLARTKSHKKWANEKLRELQQPATLQRFSCSETKVSVPTDPRITQTTDLSYTNHTRNVTKKPTQDPSTLCGSISTPRETPNTQEPELRNRIDDHTIPSGIPSADNEGITYAERTGSNINMIVQHLPPAAQRKDANNHHSEEPDHDIQRKTPTNIQTDGLVGCPFFADDRSPPRPLASETCNAPSTRHSKTSSNFVRDDPRVSNVFPCEQNVLAKPDPKSSYHLYAERPASPTGNQELAMDTEESPSKADVTAILTTYTAPNRAICYGGSSMELDDHANWAGTPESIPSSHPHELDMDVDTYMSKPKPSIPLKLSGIAPSVITDVE